MSVSTFVITHSNIKAILLVLIQLKLSDLINIVSV